MTFEFDTTAVETCKSPLITSVMKHEHYVVALYPATFNLPLNKGGYAYHDQNAMKNPNHEKKKVFP